MMHGVLLLLPGRVVEVDTNNTSHYCHDANELRQLLASSELATDPSSGGRQKQRDISALAVRAACAWRQGVIISCFNPIPRQTAALVAANTTCSSLCKHSQHVYRYAGRTNVCTTLVVLFRIHVCSGRMKHRFVGSNRMYSKKGFSSAPVVIRVGAAAGARERKSTTTTTTIPPPTHIN